MVVTERHPAAPTKPLELGAPLPEDYRLLHIEQQDLIEELRRAEVELVHALGKHRKAWAAMRARQKKREKLAETPGGLCAIEADPHWKKATGDVKWWANEITCQGTAILALKALLHDRAAAKERRDVSRA